MRVACCQFDIAWENKPANYLKVRTMIETARPAPGTLVVLPEMFSTGFSMNVPAIRENSKAETEMFLASMARTHRVFVLGGLVTADPEGRGRNEAVVFDPTGTRLVRYSKIHPFSPAGEAEHYAAGEEISIFAWQGFTVAPFICYDLRFPELFRCAVRRHADLFVVIANWPVHRESHWITLLRARAIENQAYLIGLNRCGHDPKFRYSGRSLVVDPQGEILADAGETEGVLAATLDRHKLTAWRNEFPALKDMRASYPAS